MRNYGEELLKINFPENLGMQTNKIFIVCLKV
jgi:hypothetical protein